MTRDRWWATSCAAVVLALTLVGCTRTEATSPATGPTSAAVPVSPAVSTSAAGPTSAAVPASAAVSTSAAASTSNELPTSPTVSVSPVAPTSTPVTTAPEVHPAPSLPSVGLSGVNDSACRSSARPVVLLHGTFSTVPSNFTALVPALLAAHRCVFALQYGNGGIGAITTSADEFADFVTMVQTVTGARQVDVIAYSQGGLVLRTGLRLNGLADRVATAVLIAPSWNGTTSSLAGALPARLCPACADQVAGSTLLRRLDVGGDLDGAVQYAEISTTGDTVVTPIGSQVPAGPADRVRSVVLQSQCPSLTVDHIHLPALPGVIDWVVSALETGGRPSPAALTC